MDFNGIIQHLEDKASGMFAVDESKTIIFVLPENWQNLAKILKDDAKLKFDYLMCISSYDKGDNKNYGVAYNFFSTTNKHYLELRIEIEDGISIPSVVSLWKAADWHEREAYDMMGIVFEGHPNFKRILLSDDWEGHPLRKNYEEPDYYHGMPVPKDKSYWE